MSSNNNGIGLRSAVAILALLAAGVGLTGLMYAKSRQTQAVTMQEPMVENLAVSTQPAATEPITTAPYVPTTVPTTPATVPTQPAVEAFAPSEEPTVSTVPTERKALATASPVPGDTIGQFAMEALSYNETTRDWRIHNGIDLAAEPGSPVCAAAEGTVYTTYEDDTLGYTVVIRHEGGYTTRYSSLSEDLCVKPGDRVSLGQTIGYAADTALVETVMGSHVHFSVSCQDVPMNPEEFLNLS